MTLQLAHVGHYLWVLYLVPVVFVVAGILRTVILERRRDGGD
jgi:cytochrome c-type biogenesis protein CcmH/NrfF